MSLEWLVVSIIMLAMNAFLILVFWTTRQRAEVQVKDLFYRKLEDMEQVAKDRLDEMARVEEQLGEQEERLLQLKNRQKEIESWQPEGSSRTGTVNPLSVKAVHYRNTEAMEQYRYIKEQLNLDTNQIVANVMSQLEDLEQEHLVYQKLLVKFPYEMRYQILTMPQEDKLQVMEQVLTPEEKEILEEYLELYPKSREDFDVPGFFDYVTSEAEERDGTIWVYTADSQNPLKIKDERVQWRHSPDICEGCRIRYKDRLYDFSL